MTKKRVVITGMGGVTCHGPDLEVFHQKLIKGESGVIDIDDLDLEGLHTKFAARAKDFNPEDVLDKKEARRIDLCIPYAMSAARDAVKMANLDPKSVDPIRAGVIIGSGMGGMTVFLENAKTLCTRGITRVSPFFVPYIITNMAGAKVAIDMGFKGPNYSISTACATSNHSMIAAAEHIRSGHADIMLTGGVEATICQLTFGGFSSMRALSRSDNPQTASKPWDKKRDGFVLGDGCGVFVLESLESALERGAPILAEYNGGFVTCDAHHMTEPTPDGSDVARCIEGALADGGLKAEDVDLVNAHATSTPVGDLCEVRAIKKVFGKTLDKLKVHATKSIIGHGLGAAGALEMIAILQAIKHGQIHPTINVDEPEEELAGIDIVNNGPIEQEVTCAVSNSFGFGGHNAVVAVSKYQGV